MAFKRNSVIIPANQPAFYIKTDGACDKQKQEYSGKINLTITAADDLYIGSGFKNTDRKTVYNDVMELDKKAIIPGSSLKGAVRHIADIASDGCLIDLYRYNKKYNRKYHFDVKPMGQRIVKGKIVDKNCTADERCIICDMFGMMGRKSKISFSDFISENAENRIIEVNSQYGPEINNPIYHDENDTVYGYKIYKTKCGSYTMEKKDSIRVVNRGAVFKGSVFFEKLTEKELELLCFSLGLSEKFNVKLGGYKNEGLGQVSIRGEIEGITESVSTKTLAERYVQKYGTDNIGESIRKLEEHLAPHIGGRVK